MGMLGTCGLACSLRHRGLVEYVMVSNLAGRLILQDSPVLSWHPNVDCDLKLTRKEAREGVVLVGNRALHVSLARL